MSASSDTKPRLSVVTCTHNPRPDYFQRVLDALRRQTLPVVCWDYVIVDNRSVRSVAGQFEFSWHPAARIVQEETLGLTPARLRGTREARGDLLVFVDDDNVLDDDYLEIAARVAAEKPFLGAWSGQCRPEFEVPPPEWSRRYFGNLVLREFDKDVWSNLPRLVETMPCGAGLCVRRNVAEHYLELHDAGARRVQLGRTGEMLLAGEDNDLAACACDIGLGMGLITSLRLTHLVPPQRLTLSYIAKLAEGIHYSGALLDYLRGLPLQKPSLVRKMVFWLRWICMSKYDATIARAVERGKSRARLEVIKLSR
jgi:glycosyltransferase involved in cell wall biosynthesis